MPADCAYLYPSSLFQGAPVPGYAALINGRTRSFTCSAVKGLRM